MTAAHTLAEVLDRTKRRAEQVRPPRWRWAYLIALTPVLTDWIDAGHVPLEPREWFTEFVLGGLVLAVIHQLYESRDRYRDLAERDALTGLWNRRRFESDIERAAEAGKPNVVLAYVDLDRFKDVNDQLGHEVGDVLLRTLATTLRENTRQETDRAYRIGGDEFAVLFENTDEAGARLVLERIGERFKEHVFAKPTACEVSFGLAVLTSAAPGEIIRRADQAMYAQKRASVRSMQAVPLKPKNAEG